MSTARTMRRARKVVLVSLATAGLALTSACSSGGSDSSGAGSSGSGSSGSGSSQAMPSATGAAITAQSTSLGTILVDGQGRTVYVFANDKPDQSTCNGQCATNWPPVPAPSTLPDSLPGVTGELGTTTRSDGSEQLTVAHHPVYTFSGDSAPGQTNGQGIMLDGGLWTVVLPSGEPDAHPAGASSPAPVPGY